MNVTVCRGLSSHRNPYLLYQIRHECNWLLKKASGPSSELRANHLWAQVQRANSLTCTLNICCDPNRMNSCDSETRWEVVWSTMTLKAELSIPHSFTYTRSQLLPLQQTHWDWRIQPREITGFAITPSVTRELVGFLTLSETVKQPTGTVWSLGSQKMDPSQQSFGILIREKNDANKWCNLPVWQWSMVVLDFGADRGSALQVMMFTCFWTFRCWH